MNREPLFRRKTAIAYKTEEKTVLRGYDLGELAEEGYSFCDAIYILFQGRIPSSKEEEMLKYEMGEFMEHSMSPSAGGAIAVIAGSPNLPAAVAAAVTQPSPRADNSPRGLTTPMVKARFSGIGDFGAVLPFLERPSRDLTWAWSSEPGRSSSHPTRKCSST